MIVIGIKRVTGTSKKTGNPYSGFNLYCQYEADGTEGHACISQYVSDKVCSGVQLGADVTFNYNKFGSVQSVQVA